MFELCMVSSGPPLSIPGSTDFFLYDNTLTCLACQMAYDSVIESIKSLHNNISFVIKPESKTTMITTWFNTWNLNKPWLKKLMYGYDEFWENEIYV